MAERLTTIPPPRPEDNDDVRWALSTATALWSSGASDDALKWLRRAGETASELDDDARAVELFKAAASIRTSMLPPPLAMTAVTWDPPGVEPVSEVRTRLDPRLVGYAQAASPSAESPAPSPPAPSPPPFGPPAPAIPSAAAPSSTPPARRPPPPPRGGSIAPSSRRTPPPGLEAPPSSRRGSVPAPPPVPARAARIGSIPPARPTPRMRSQHDTSLGVGKGPGVGRGEPPKTQGRVIMPSVLRETQIGLGAVRVQGGAAVPAIAARPSKVTPSSVKLSSTRFVVVPGARRGELTLKAIASDADPPAGAAVAVVVPRSINDAEMIDRILEAGAEFFDLHHDDQPTNPGAPGERTRRAC